LHVNHPIHPNESKPMSMTHCVQREGWVRQTA